MERGLEASARRYAAENEAALIELIETLCGIPAPSHQEAQRAQFVKAWFEKNGFPDVTVDAAQSPQPVHLE